MLADNELTYLLFAICTGDEGLYRDLLRKAHGDEQLARRWLSTICGHGNEGPSDLIAAASKPPTLT
jgi:hypothetical protein